MFFGFNTEMSFAHTFAIYSLTEVVLPPHLLFLPASFLEQLH